MMHLIKRRIVSWDVGRVCRERHKISFPDYQREPNLWDEKKKALLIDSIFENIDIPKLYVNETPEGNYEVVDGQQRLWAIWDFVDGAYSVEVDGREAFFDGLSDAEREWLESYQLQFTILFDAPDSYLRKLFVRLQIGLLLVTGEKLNAATGMMKNFVFHTLVKQRFMQQIKIPRRRYAKETLGAQIAINSFSLGLGNGFSRTRYSDLELFFEEYSAPTGRDLSYFREASARVTDTMRALNACMGSDAQELRNRSYILSVYLLFESLSGAGGSDVSKREFSGFVLKFWKELKRESKRGIKRTNQALYSFENMLSSAPGERYQIERRHQALLAQWRSYVDVGVFLDAVE